MPSRACAALVLAVLLTASCSSGPDNFVSPAAEALKHEAARVALIDIDGRHGELAPYDGLCTYGDSIDGVPMAYAMWKRPQSRGTDVFAQVHSALLAMGYVLHRPSGEASSRRSIRPGATEIVYFRTGERYRFRVSVTQNDRSHRMSGVDYPAGTLDVQVLVRPDGC